jgi:hypothetical protein
MPAVDTLAREARVRFRTEATFVIRRSRGDSRTTNRGLACHDSVTFGRHLVHVARLIIWVRRVIDGR